MKIKQIFFLILFSTIFSETFSYISNNEISLGAIEKDSIAKNAQEKKEFLRSLDLQQAERLEKDLLDNQTKYIQTTKPALDYLANTFYGPDYFFLGSNSAGAQTYSLMRAKINTGSTQANNTVQFVAMSPEQVYLNGIKEDNKLVQKNNPIYDKRVDKLTLQGRYPVLTLQDVTTVNGTAFGANKLVCLVSDFNSGTNVKTNEIEINDANSAATNGVVGLAASSNQIFAAVKPNGGNFGQDNSGFAALITKDDKLKPIDVVNGDEDANLAFNLDRTAGQLLAIEQNAANTLSFGDMYWDASLQRLFIGLTGVTGSAVNLGGAVSILVGRIDGKKLLIEPVVSLDSTLFTSGSTNYVFGYYDNANATSLSTYSYKLKTMKTSTGKHYLIVNGIANNADIKNYIFAFPIVGSTQSDGTVTAEANIGKVADKNNVNHDVVVQNNAGMHLYNDSGVWVGGEALDIPVDSLVKDLFVVNDSVYVCLDEDRSDDQHESGIFRSTALFDTNGNVRAWTPWQRVAGTIDKVYGAGIDISTENFWYFTDDGTYKNTVKVTQWGKGSSAAGQMGNGLVELLSDQFTQENAGVHQIFNFDEKTPGISRNTILNEMSFMVATGYGKINLIPTGGGIIPNPEELLKQIFVPSQIEFTELNTFNINDDALTNLGPINCVEVSRSTGDDSGWLFIGGYNGVAVWSPDTGDGWDSNITSDEKVNFANLINGDGFSFKEVGDFSQVRKLVCEGNSNKLYVMTIDSISRIEMAANKFATAPALLNSRTITPPPGYLLDVIIFYRAAGDTRLLVATSLGLFYSNVIDDFDVNKTPIWTRVILNSGSELSKPVTDLTFLDVQKGGFSTNGNLYALSADLSLNLAFIYRFDIQNGQINPIKEKAGTDYFYSFGELRTNFITDGSFGYSMLSKHFGSSEFLRNIRMIDTQNSIRSFESNLNLDLESTAYNVGKMVQNTASGAWVIPGDWGIRVNE
jgi:hypothetical protein